MAKRRPPRPNPPLPPLTAEERAAAAAYARLFASTGGRARAAKLTAAERSASARKAARARWKKKS